MRNLIIALLVPLAMACSNSQTTRILVVTGGHDYDYENFVKVFQNLENTEFDEMIQPVANEIYGSDSIDKYDVLVFYDMVQEISESQKEAFLKMLNEGKGLVFLHHSIASYQDWDEFIKVLGAKYYLEAGMQGKDSIPASTYTHGQDVSVEIIDRRHPVTKGLDDFEIHEEVYDLIQLHPGIHPLMTTGHPESSDTIVWANKYGKSRIVYIQFGHDNNSYSNPNFTKLLSQAIDWAK